MKLSRPGFVSETKPHWRPCVLARHACSVRSCCCCVSRSRTPEEEDGQHDALVRCRLGRFVLIPRGAARPLSSPPNSTPDTPKERPSSPSPSHTHLSPALPSLGLCLDVRGYRNRRFHVQSFATWLRFTIKISPQACCRCDKDSWSAERTALQQSVAYRGEHGPPVDRTPTLSSVFSRVHSSVTTCQ